MNQPTPRHASRLQAAVADRFNLLADKAPNDVIERRIRDVIELRGATPWILMFAILVASIGLNVNSTAVIIGAMLISPLMGPIMGVGHGIAVHDFALARSAMKNLVISTVIGLLVSALYFMLTPLSEAQSELLARTSPTLWDVLIALFGGMAGIIGVTREEKSQVIPGVAIATALMPPLCTAGYGLATGQWNYFGGAFYLYSINAVFIALATFAGIRLLRLPYHAYVDKGTERKLRYAIWGIALATTIPSIYLATLMVKDELYKSRANQFVRDEFVFKDAHVVDTRVDPATRAIDVSLIGNPISKATLGGIEGKLAVAGLPDSRIVLHQSGEYEKVDVTQLRAGVLSDLYKQSQEAIAAKDRQLDELRASLRASQRFSLQAGDMAEELRAQFPALGDVTLSQGIAIDAEGARVPVSQLAINGARGLDAAERERIQAWFKVRSKAEATRVLFDD
ncbi:TIGR00341 family protein [Thermomonas brevis]